jgi:hypothetical protein
MRVDTVLKVQVSGLVVATAPGPMARRRTSSRLRLTGGSMPWTAQPLGCCSAYGGACSAGLVRPTLCFLAPLVLLAGRVLVPPRLALLAAAALRSACGSGPVPRLCSPPGVLPHPTLCSPDFILYSQPCPHLSIH